MSRQPVRILVVDDDPEVRSTLVAVIATDDGLTVRAQAQVGHHALAALDAHGVDVVLLDIRMPNLDGLGTLELLRQRGHRAHVLMLTTFGEADYVRRAIAGGADGFLLKSGHPTDLLRAIHGTMAGETWLAPAVARFTAEDTHRVQAGLGETRTAQARLGALTAREREVAEHVAGGLSNAEIGGELHLSESTVKAYLSSALSRLSLRNRVELAALVWQADAGSRQQSDRAD